MAESDIGKQLKRMREDWDRRARENARHYIATGQEQWSDEEFYGSGEATVREQILNDLTNICQGKDPKDMTVLEIGCGTGRVTRALANLFGAVYGVDISAEMVSQARKGLAGLPNVHIHRNNGRDLCVLRRRWWSPFAAKLQFDFAFSFIVFQHIASTAIIESYVRDVNRMLRPGALFKFQVQGSPSVEVEQDDTWVGVSFTEGDARAMADRCRFEMRYNHGAGDQFYWLWFFKKSE